MLFERGLQTDGELEAGFGAALAQQLAARGARLALWPRLESHY